MDCRERTFLALDFQEPDRVPIDLWMSPGFRRKLEAERRTSASAFLDAHDVDLRYIDGPAYTGPPLKRFADGTDEDIWGVRRRMVTLPLKGGVEIYREVAASPLVDAERPEEIDAYGHWPSADWFDYSGIETQCEALRRAGRVAVFMGDRLNRIAQLKPAMYLRGVEQILTDMILKPEIARAIFRNISGFYLAYAERIFEAARGKLDIMLMGDDFGAQSGPLVSPGAWRDFIAEGFEAYCSLARAHGIRVMHHSCGSVKPMIPLMMERGLEILQSLQPEAADMEPHALKTAFGDTLAFHGGISIQKTLPFGTPEEVRREVRDRVEALAPGGGYILCTSHNIQADTPIENLDALLAAYREYGRYS